MNSNDSLKVWKPSFKYQFTSPKILVKTKMNRQGLVLTYILGQVPIFLQEWQKSVQIDIAIYEKYILMSQTKDVCVIFIERIIDYKFCTTILGIIMKPHKRGEKM